MRCMETESRRIIVYLPALTGGGAERVMLNLAHGFISAGCDVDLVVSSLSGPYLAEVPEGVLLHDLGTRRVSRSFWKFFHFIKARPHAVVFTTLQYANIFCMLLKIFFRIKNPVFIRESNAVSRKLRGRNLRERAFRFLIQTLYASADGIIAVSRGVKSDLTANFRIPPQNIAVIPNPVVVPAALPEQHNSAPHAWLEEGNPPVILGVGRLEAQKDFETLIEAFAQVRKRLPCRLIILGEGSRRAALMKVAQALDVSDHVDLPGFVLDPFSFMRKAGVFVLSSRWEGFPNALIQALSCGCQVVSTDCPFGPAEILEEGKYGALVRVGEPQEMAERIAEILNGHLLMNEGVDWHARYAEDSIVNQYLRFFGL